jgi:hypothetical protein
MWVNLRRFWKHLHQLVGQGSAQRRTEQSRARFWRDVREGQREAEDQSNS